MRLTAYLILATCMQVAARGDAQSVTLSEKNAPILKVFKDIRRQTGFQFFYEGEVLSKVGPVTFEVKNGTVEEVLAKCFQNLSLSYSIVGKTIVVKAKEAPAAPPSTVIDAAAPQDIHGRIVDSTGAPIAGASVLVKGTHRGTATDANGEFDIKGVNGDATLIVSFTGFETRQYRYNGQKGMVILLQRSTSPLDEVQIIAYGTRSVREQTGDVTTVKAKDIEKQPVNNPMLALEGRVPGLFITQANGLPGSSVVTRIQGQNSILKGNDPLYVVDGVPYVSQLLPTANVTLLGDPGAPVIFGGSGYGSGSPLSYLNPGDIESIEVLKDADATAIYGSRAANGAILITTKKGRAGKTKFDLNMQTGWGKVTEKLNLLNNQQYLQMRREAIKNDGLTIGSTDYDINGTWDTTRHTDWQKALLGGTADYTNISGSLSGGTSNLQYLAGGTYHRETTVFPGDLSDEKASMHFNINNVSANQRFRLEVSGNYLVDENHLINNDPTFLSTILAPDAPPAYNADGSLNWASPNNSPNTSSWTNPFSYLLSKYNIETKNLIGNSTLSYKILPGLEIKSSFGYTNLQTNEVSAFPLSYWRPESRAAVGRRSVFVNNNVNSWIIEPQANYKLSISKGKLDVLVGSTIHQVNSNGLSLVGSGFNSDLVMQDIKSAAAISVNSSVVSQYKYNAAFGRINYNWDDKYIINISGRRDGSSRFGSKNQFHDFGSAAIAWIFSNESFIRNKLGFLSFGKIRGSYGTTGNDQIGDYQFMNLYSAPSGVGVPYQGATGLLPTGLPNPYIEWEETKKAEVGVELGLFHDRILVSTNYYHNRSSNELLPYALPNITGFSSISTVNFPATVENTGLEFTLTTSNIKNQTFGWTTNFNLTVPRNELIAFPSLSTSSYANVYVVGKPITLVKVFRFAGVNLTTGLFQFLDQKGNTTSSPNASTDNTAIVNMAPEFYGGFDNAFSYKGFELDFLFQFVRQVGRNDLFGIGNGVGLVNTNEPTWVLGRWQKSGDVSAIQRYSSNFNYFTQLYDARGSNAGITDASYVRLKNLSLSWQIPASWKGKMHLGNGRLYLQAQNLLTLTNYKGLDPETRSSNVLPPLRIITVGAQITL